MCQMCLSSMISISGSLYRVDDNPTVRNSICGWISESDENQNYAIPAGTSCGCVSNNWLRVGTGSIAAKRTGEHP